VSGRRSSAPGSGGGSLFIVPMEGMSFFHKLKAPVTAAFAVIAGAFSYIYLLHWLRNHLD
jgi:hypothetical protein